MRELFVPLFLMIASHAVFIGIALQMYAIGP
jgi:hypothetical protein